MKGLTLPLQKRNLRTLLAGIGLILLTNAVVLAGVAYNRSGTPESSITLTERELGLPFYSRMRKENSGISVRITMRNKGSALSPYYSYRREANWLTKEKLAELGFDVSKPIDDTQDWRDFKRQKEREIILVLEYDGEAYQALLNAAQQQVAELTAKLQDNSSSTSTVDKNKLKQAKNTLQREQNSASRLFVIDAGLDPEALRQQYPDNSKYLLLKGVAGIYINRDPDGTRKYDGYIKTLSITNINIPLEYHDALQPALDESYKQGKNLPPRYEITLNIGKRLEPWVVGVKEL